MLFEFKIKGYQEKLHSFDYYKKCLDNYKYPPPKPPNISNLKKFDYLFWEPLLKMLQDASVDTSIKYIFIESVDRGVHNFEQLGLLIKEKYPNVEEMYFNQNFTSREYPDTDTWRTCENFFINMGLKRLMFDIFQSYEYVATNDGELLEQLIEDNEKANSPDFIEWDSDGCEIYVNLDITLDNDTYTTLLHYNADPNK